MRRLRRRASGLASGLLCGVVILALPLASASASAWTPADVWDDTRYFLYWGRLTDTRYLEIVRLGINLQPSNVLVAGATRRVATMGGSAHIEGEVNLAQHWGMQSHQEINGLMSVRWLRFPWDHYVDTSLAAGLGLSFASRHPPIEEAPDRPPASRRLTYLMTELEFSRPETPHIGLLVRIHHRSGIFGVISDARGSNFVGVGVRSSF
jgi:hypothetical protein